MLASERAPKTSYASYILCRKARSCYACKYAAHRMLVAGDASAASVHLEQRDAGVCAMHHIMRVVEDRPLRAMTRRDELTSLHPPAPHADMINRWLPCSPMLISADDAGSRKP